MNYLFVQDRESGKWFFAGALPFWHMKDGRKTKSIQYTNPSPAPEEVSAFIKAHKVIEAKTEEEAKCQLSSLI